MQKNKESGARVFLVTLVVCVVCSLIVSSAAIYLQPKQDHNRLINKKKNILIAAGYAEKIDTQEIEELYDEIIEEKYFDLATGQSFNNPNDVESKIIEINSKEDIAGLKTISTEAVVYFVRNMEHQVHDGHASAEFGRIVLPVSGKGIWSTMYGLLTLSSDLTTIENLSFYEHGETPGLGGEIDNIKWQSKWVGKKPFNEEMKPIMEVVQRGAFNQNQVDGISGATLTSIGVEHMINFWLGDLGYGVILQKINEEMLHD